MLQFFHSTNSGIRTATSPDIVLNHPYCKLGENCELTQPLHWSPTHIGICFGHWCLPGSELQPGKVAPFIDGVLNVTDADRKRIEYMVLGDADTEAGLLVPFDEEETKSLLHVESCTQQTIFDFWLAHANNDQVTGRVPEFLVFQDVRRGPSSNGGSS